MIYLVTHYFKALNTGEIAPEEYFVNAYIEEYLNRSMSVLPLNNYSQSWLLNTKSQIRINQ